MSSFRGVSVGSGFRGPSFADSMPSRLIHNSYRFELDRASIFSVAERAGPGSTPERAKKDRQAKRKKLGGNMTGEAINAINARVRVRPLRFGFVVNPNDRAALWRVHRNQYLSVGWSI
jgi:hypothetical protein